MNPKSYRLWYFEAHLLSGQKVAVDRAGAEVSGDAVLRSAFVGTESQAHAEADSRCAAYDKTHAQEAKAMSFSPAATLNALPKPSGNTAS